MKKKDDRTPVVVDGQNIAFSHGEFLNKKNDEEGRFFSYQGLIDLAYILDRNYYKPVIFLPEFTRISAVMEKGMKHCDNPAKVKKEFKALAKKREIQFLKCKHDEDDYLMMDYAYQNQCVIISNDKNFEEHLKEDLNEEEQKDWKKWLKVNVKQYHYAKGFFEPNDYWLEYNDINVDYTETDFEDDIILLDSDVDYMFTSNMSNFY